MKATELFTGSFKLIGTHLKTAQLLLLPLFIFYCGMFYWISTFQIKLSLDMIENGGVPNWAPFILPFLGMIFVSILLSATIAVAWHRRVLLEEKFSWSIGSIFRSQVWGYIGWCIVIGLIYIALLLPVAFLIGLVGSVAGLLVIPVLIAIVFAVLVVIIRLMVKLPSVAVGSPITFGDAWQATKGQSWMIVRTYLIMILAYIPFAIIIYMAQGNPQQELMQAVLAGKDMLEAIKDVFAPNYFVILVQSAMSSVMALFGVGILTILYSAFVLGKSKA